jgi:hypothetical protein
LDFHCAMVFVMVKNIFVRQNKIVILRRNDLTLSAWKNLAAISCLGKKRLIVGVRQNCGCPEPFRQKMFAAEPSSTCNTILLEFCKGVCYAKEGRLFCLFESPRSDGKPNVSEGLRCVSWEQRELCNCNKILFLRDKLLEQSCKNLKRR